MPILPDSRLGQIQFFEDHIPVWSPTPSAIGLSALQVTTITNLTTAARNAFNAAQAARQASTNATTAYYEAVRQMRLFGGDLINSIKAFAEATSNPTVYTTAQIPPNASPTPAPAPAAPKELTTQVENDGSITLKWKVTQPAPGAEVYTVVLRQLNGTGAFTQIGDTGEKTFNDAAVPPGTSRATYMLQAKRGGQSSPFGEPVICFLGVPQDDAEEGGQGLQLAA
jgi:hypothetical protein